MFSFLCPHSFAYLSAAEAPTPISEFTRQYCADCHGSKKQKGDFRIDALAWDLSDSESRKQWDLVRDYVTDGDMPPKKAEQPTAQARQAFLNGLSEAYARADQNAKPGGTPLRRLNRVEYLNTIRDLFGIRMLNLPLSFPADATSAEFDTMPEGLFLSAAVMEGYHDMATIVADRIAPLPNPPTYEAAYEVSDIGGDTGRRWFGDGKKFLKFTGFNVAGWTGALWDALFVAPASGVYRVRLLANARAAQGADGKPLRLSFYAFDPTTEPLPKRFRPERATLVAEVNVPTGKPTWIDCNIPVEAGETFHIYCANRFPEDKFPGGDLNRTEINGVLRQRATKDPTPTVELRGLTVKGPVEISPYVEQFYGAWPPKLSRRELTAKLLPLAARAFRRPLTRVEKQKLIASVLRHGQKVERPEFAWHYAIRRILCSPEFLFRETGRSLDDHALASRLSYFLWSTMPDEELLQLAGAGKLRNPKILAAQTKRLLNDPRAHQFTKHFTGQWLGNRAVAAINVCDNRYQWDDNVRYGFVRSTEMFFAEVLRENLPISTFIESDFTYANSAMQAVWKMKLTRDKNLGQIATRQRQSLIWPEPQRLAMKELPEDTPAHVRARGGVLGLPGVLTVTGDGVESSPILCGVWVLENLFGQHPPPPPKDVPALAVLSAERVPALPEVGTCLDEGIEVTSDNAYYWWAPKGTPPAVIETLSDALLTAWEKEEVRETLNEWSISPDVTRGEALLERVQDRVSKMEKFAVRAESDLPNFPLYAFLIAIALVVVVVIKSMVERPVPSADVPPQYRPAIIAFAIVIAYVLLLQLGLVPFALASIAMVFCCGAVISGWQRQRWPVLAEIALLAGLGSEFVFTRIFTVALP